MNTIRRAALLGVLAIAWLVGSVSVLAVQEGAALARPALTDAQMEDFLLNARIGDTKGVNKGVTNTRRATLSDGRITHDAHIQTVDVSKALLQPDRGPAELNFRDSYHFNIAGYRLARLLGLDNVPVSVERRVHQQSFMTEEVHHESQQEFVGARRCDGNRHGLPGADHGIRAELHLRGRQR